MLHITENLKGAPRQLALKSQINPLIYNIKIKLFYLSREPHRVPKYFTYKRLK